MLATGQFDVELKPAQDSDYDAGRMLINKSYSGQLQGSGKGQMLSKRSDSGSAAYVAIEEFNGSVDGKVGSFSLLHRGLMSSENQSLDIVIIEGSGTGELHGIEGELSIEQKAGEHLYQLNYQLPG
ncbi:DUF3224 domain-containing protein [Agaribacterium haliotis]|uniref:DUF3224 domain-containing protein n=1 Tax=Agaribacterium haliotis TaxID=2013869 RepID=UPI000BB571D6|nr:DUF3224 domain-containing protein [Agaribacterium haliotis]